jgi:hypothetical protein
VDIFTSSFLRYRLFWRHISRCFLKGLRKIFCSLADVWSFSLLITSLPSKDVHRIRSEVLTETSMNFQVFRDVKCVWVVSDVSTNFGTFIFKNYIIKFFLGAWSERNNVTSQKPWIRSYTATSRDPPERLQLGNSSQISVNASFVAVRQIIYLWLTYKDDICTLCLYCEG